MCLTKYWLRDGDQSEKGLRLVKLFEQYVTLCKIQFCHVKFDIDNFCNKEVFLQLKDL